jgi:Fic family protein
MSPYIPEKLPIENLNYMPLISLIAKANAAVARYDGYLQNIPNPEVLVTPLITQEAVLSSKIEGTQATIEDVLEYEANKNEILGNDDIFEILNYRNAIDYAIKRLTELPLCLRLLKELHSILLNSVRGSNKSRGEFRKVQNWIGIPGSTIGEATYIPPDVIHLNEALGNFEKYLNSDDYDSLVQIAILHAQFEMIHPFLDGNGRLGRMLIPLFLYYKKVLSSPMFYMSQYLEKHRETYYAKLRAISNDGNWIGWIKFFLNGIIEQADVNLKKAKAIMNLYDFKKERIRKVTHSQYSIKILDALFIKPIFNSKDFIDLTGIPEKTAYKYIKMLKDNNIIVSNDKERYQTYYFIKLLNIVQ